jgi:hypothetical protein
VAKTNGKAPKRVVSIETRQRQSKAQLSLKQMRFVKEYAHLGNGTEAARRAGYSQSSDNVLSQMATENLRKPAIAHAVEGELARIALDVTPTRVKRRLDEISHAAQAEGQFGPAVRAEELLGKSIGMWIDQTLQLTGALSDTHIAALIEIARRRQAEPVDLGDDEERYTKRNSDSDEG